MLFFVRRRSNSQRKALIFFNKIAQDQKIFNYTSLESKKAIFARIHEFILPFMGHFSKNTYVAESNKSALDVNHINNLVLKLSKLCSSSNMPLERIYNSNKTFNNVYSSRSQKKSITISKNLLTEERNINNNRLTTFTHRAYTRRNNIQQQNNVKEQVNSVFVQKIIHYQKLAFSLRFRKAALPSAFRYINKSKAAVTNFTFKRNKLLRFYFKKYKKSVQKTKRIRLKGVHFYIPSYLQMDFRTLRAIKIQSASQEDIYYPFRISLSKRYSFYHSRGY